MADNPFYDGIDDELTIEELEDDELEDLIGLPEEWYEKYENKWHGRFVALVIDNKDPKKLGRLRVECPRVFGMGLTSPWCEPGMIGADSHQGLVWIPEKGAIVWLDFPEGEAHEPDEAPMWTYGPWYDESTGLPPHAQEIQDDSDADTQTLKGRGVGFIPASTYATIYPHWKGLRTLSGHMLEFDDTPNQERVQLYHKSGAFLEMTVDGSVSMAAMAKMKLATIGEFRMASMDATAALAGNEIGMVPVGGTYGPKGWLGQKTASTEPLVCGNLLVTYLTALHGALTAVINALKADVAFVAQHGTAITALDIVLNTTIPGLATTYFTPSPTSFLSDLWFTQKLGPFTPEA